MAPRGSWTMGNSDCFPELEKYDIRWTNFTHSTMEINQFSSTIMEKPMNEPWRKKKLLEEINQWIIYSLIHERLAIYDHWMNHSSLHHPWINYSWLHNKWILLFRLPSYSSSIHLSIKSAFLNSHWWLMIFPMEKWGPWTTRHTSQSVQSRLPYSRQPTLKKCKFWHISSFNRT